LEQGDLFQQLLCTLSSCLTHEYHYVSNPKTWTEAQRYCREKYTDLATIENMEDMNRLINTVDIGYNGSVWIGLEKGDIMVWQWSLANRDYYGEEGTGFRNNEHCVVMTEGGEWQDEDCNEKPPFICYTSIGEKASYHQRRYRTLPPISLLSLF
uniref:C-type lectin domain-containing protein n=1 Tax=Oncorhynchus tshawytscha TaxID=74940 RepID=A0AAZ3QB84_ONCTS